MASTSITTTTQATTIAHGRNIEIAGSRLWVLENDGTNLELRYSDNDGGTWSSGIVVAAGSTWRGAVFYDADNTRLNVCYAGENTASAKLGFRAITSNVASGTPGSLTSEAVIDAGGSNLGVQFPFMFYSNTSTRPRYWIIGKKWTAAGTSETRAWHVNVATATDADTAGNWSTTNFTNLGSNSNGNDNKMGVGAWWTVGGSDKVTLIFCTGTTNFPYEFCTFDPTVATPTPGTIGTFGDHAGNTFLDWNSNGPTMAINAKANYLIFGRLDPTDNTWDFYKSTAGTSFTQPTGWDSLTMGRCQIALSGSDFYLVHTNLYGAISTSAQTLQYRLVTASSDTMGGVSTFSDTTGNGVSVPLDTGTSKLYGVYRTLTASPYGIRSDTVSLGGGSDTTAPSQATVTASVSSSTALSLSITLPSDIDVASYEVRYLTGATAPATDRSNGTTAVAETASSANAEVVSSITGLTAGTRITGRVFVKDTAGNWNTGSTFTAVPAATPAFLGRYRSDGVTAIADDVTAGGNNVILEYQLAANCFDSSGGNAAFRYRIGYDSATPPSQSSFDMTSPAATGEFKYESSTGVWTTVPGAGLSSSAWTKKLRVYTSTLQAAQYGSLRVEQ